MSSKRKKSQSPLSCSQSPSQSGAEANETGSAQHSRFIETARQLGCDEDEKAFDEKLKKIATAKPAPGKRD